MKLIQAVIRPSALNAVRTALTAVGIGGVSVAESSACDALEALSRSEPAHVYREPCEMNMRLEIAVTDEQLERALEAISAAVQGEKIEDGKIFVVSLSQARRIRTGEANDKAL
ncbi:MAG: P-II family nitrogen regulator [Pseudomonadota bacterium]|nr:P-II family nitrogen regulator [Pseudomonadota bacterium]